MQKSHFIGAALAFALIAGGPVAPVYAKDKPAAAESINDKIRPSLVAAQDAVTKKDYPTAFTQLDIAEPLAVSPYEKFVVGQFRAIGAQAMKDNKQMVRGLDFAIDSGYSTPAIATYALLSGQLSYNDGNYAKAITRLTKAQQLGNTEESLPLLIADCYYKSNRTAEGLAIIEKAYAADQAAKKVTSQDTLARTAQAALTAKMPKETMLWLGRLVSAYPTANNWHDMLVIYRDGHPVSAQGVLDLYRLMKATKSFRTGSEVEEYSITALDKRGLPGEAKAALDDGVADGSITKMTAGMIEVKNAATTKSASDRASLPAAEKLAGSSPTGRVARGTADAYFGYKDYAKAIALYKLAKTKGGVEDRLVNMGLGESYALSGDKANAITSFSAVTGESADIASFWVMWLNQTQVAATK